MRSPGEDQRVETHGTPPVAVPTQPASANEIVGLGAAGGPLLPGGLSAGRVLALQRASGNRAVTRLILPNAGTGESPSGRGQRADRFGTRIVAREPESPTGDPRLATLRREARRLAGVVEADLMTRQDLLKLNEDQWIVSAIAEFVGRSGDLPSAVLWLPVKTWIAQVNACLGQGDVLSAARALQQAAEATAEAHKALQEYREATISGAEASTTALQITAAAGAVAATVATGGAAAAAGAGLTATAATVGVGAGAYGIIQEEATQGGEMIAGTREAGDFDVKTLLVRGGRDAVVGFVGALAGGKLSEIAVKRLGGAAFAQMNPAQIAAAAEGLGIEVSALTPQMFVSTGRRVIVNFLSGAAVTPLTTATEVTFSSLTGGNVPKSPAEMARLVLDNAIQGGIVQALVMAVTHGSAAAGMRSGFEPSASSRSDGGKTGAHSAGEPPDVGGVREAVGSPAHPADAVVPSESMGTPASESAGAGAAPHPNVNVAESPMSRDQELAKLIAEQAADQASGDVGLIDVEPGAANVRNLPEYEGGVATASEIFERLPDIENPKNIASGVEGDPKLSGWGGDKIEATERAMAEGLEAGAAPRPHFRDPKGSPGLYESSHSERQRAAGTSDQHFRSSAPLPRMPGVVFRARRLGAASPVRGRSLGRQRLHAGRPSHPRTPSIGRGHDRVSAGGGARVPGRQGHEGALPSRGEYEVEKIQAHYVERPHSQGQGTGCESPYGIRLAAEIVNQGYQTVSPSCSAELGRLVFSDGLPSGH